MTDVLSRPRPAPDAPAPAPGPLPPRPAAVSAVLAAGWSAAVCLAACCALSVGAWLAGSTGTAPGALRVGAVSWLLAHGGDVQLATDVVRIAPLGITALTALLLYRSGRWVAASSGVRSWRQAAWAVGPLVVGYAALVALVALLAASSQARPGPVGAVVGATVVSGLFGGIGVLHASGLLGQLAEQAPEQVRAALCGAAAGVLGLVAAGALLVGLSLSMHLSLAGDLALSAGGGAAGVLLLALIGVLLLPNGLLCAGAFLLGPGFALGAGTQVTPIQVNLDQLPLLTLLAALPAEGAQPAWVTALLVVPVIAGGVAAAVALARYPVAELSAHIVRGGTAGAAAGAVFGALTTLAVASGPGRLAELGPQPLACVLAAVAEMGLGGGVTGALWAWARRASWRIPH